MSNLARSLLISPSVWVIVPLAWTAWFIIWHPGVDLASLRYLAAKQGDLHGTGDRIVAGGIAPLVMTA